MMIPLACVPGGRLPGLRFRLLVRVVLFALLLLFGPFGLRRA
jgi:hypothetical protein